MLRHLTFTLLPILALLVISLFYFELVNNNTLFSTLGTLLALYIGSLQYGLNNDRMFKELFETFNKRYDTDINDLINTCRQDHNYELTSKEYNLVNDYLNLCSEEFLWKKKGRIPPDVWKAWKTGMVENLKVKQLKTLASIEYHKYKESYYGLFSEINFKPLPKSDLDNFTIND